MKSGSCLCGAVTYRIDGPLRPVVACHCKQCRKTSGHYVAATSAARDDMTINGPVQWYHSSPKARRGFCGTCGSNLFWESHDSTHTSIFSGTLDGDTGLEIIGHIYVADKGDYYALDDTLPKADQDHPDLTTIVTGAGQPAD